LGVIILIELEYIKVQRLNNILAQPASQ